MNTGASTGLVAEPKHVPKIGGKRGEDSAARYDKNKSGRKLPGERKPMGLPKANRSVRASSDQATKPKVGNKKPSKYVEEIIRMNLVAMVNRYEKLQAQKRRQALMKATKKLQNSFIKLYRAFRHKKYGEAPIGGLHSL